MPFTMYASAELKEKLSIPFFIAERMITEYRTVYIYIYGKNCMFLSYHLYLTKFLKFCIRSQTFDSENVTS